VPVGLVALQLLRVEGVAVRRSDQERAEVARVVGVGDVVEGDVPIWPMNGRSRVASATMSWGAKPRMGCCTELSGSAAKRAASRAKPSAASRGTVTPSERSSSNAIV